MPFINIVLKILVEYLFLHYKILIVTGVTKYVIAILGISFILTNVVAQQKSRVNIEHADTFKYNAKFGKDIQRLIGNVVIRQDSTLFYCDSAYINEVKNSFEAFSNVHIKVNDTVDVYSSRMLYDGNTKIAELFDSVRLIDKNTILTTDHLIYNRKSKTALYNIGGRIVNKNNILVSKKGVYYTSTRTFHFRKDVVLTNPDQETYSDTLIYNTNNETAYFLGPTVIRGKESMIYCENGWYDTKMIYQSLSKDHLLLMLIKPLQLIVFIMITTSFLVRQWVMLLLSTLHTKLFLPEKEESFGIKKECHM